MRVNVTLGLPILRTSVDHGTALSLARSGKADTGSLRGRSVARHRHWPARVPSMPVRKRFGQHFLHDPGSHPPHHRRGRTARPASASSKSGPGRGALTWGLLERAAALGRDRDRPRSGASAASRSAREATACACTSRTCCTPISSRLRGTRRAAARRRQPAVQHFDSAAVPAADAARRHCGHVFHAAKGSRGSNGRAAGNQGLWAPDRHARRRRRGRKPVRCRSRCVSAAAQGVVRHRAPAAHQQSPLRHRP